MRTRATCKTSATSSVLSLGKARKLGCPSGQPDEARRDDLRRWRGVHGERFVHGRCLWRHVIFLRRRDRMHHRCLQRRR